MGIFDLRIRAGRMSRRAAQIFRMMLDCASGIKSRSEAFCDGQDEFVPWQPGVIT
jgi:altronate dehydratase